MVLRPWRTGQHWSTCTGVGGKSFEQCAPLAAPELASSVTRPAASQRR